MIEHISRSTYALLVLSKLRGVGPAALNALLAHPQMDDVDARSLAELNPVVARAAAVPNALAEAEAKAERDAGAVASLDAALFSPADPEYPRLLSRTPDRPPLLYVRGNAAALRASAVGIVGTREPTEHGRIIAERIAAHFARSGWCIVSGLALGVDGIAHAAALDADACTVAVLAHGLDTVSPKRHTALAARILDSGGALVSEYAPGTPAFGPQFVKRDRIQAGLASAVILVQTDVKGGSLHASRAALEYGRILAYPVPTAKDVGQGEPKVQGVLRIHEEPRPEVARYLGCSVDALQRLIPLKSRDEYAILESVMRRTEEADIGSGSELRLL